MKDIRWGALPAAASTCCVLALAGCVGATKLPVKTNGPAGTKLENNEIDFTFLHAGSTRREEVVSRLSRIDTGYANPGMFWGRWSESKWGHWVILPSPTVVAGDVGRNWHMHNLLVSFDENGVMQSKDLIDSERDLERELHARLAKAPPLDLSKPVVVTLVPDRNAADNLWKSVTLSEKEMQFTLGDHSQSISPLKVERISYERFFGNLSAGTICHSLHLAGKSRLGNRVFFCSSAGNLATIFKYLHQQGPANMRWE